MNHAKRESDDTKKFILSLLKGLLAGIIAAAAAIPLFALVAYSTADPGKMTAYLGYAAIALASLTSGIAAVKFTGQILAGSISSAALSLLIFALSLLPVGWESNTPTAVCVAVHFGIIALGTLGALIAGKRKPQKHNKKKRKKH